ncbi:alpha/beta hydrolase [Yimella sp. cx-51]|uniref:alpha/beta hydrolase n=1 Tax=Yimella sp. cx-51 TaxID=2770551 RepID=UPI00165EAF05|nr:alpha/beta hydrolase [Yimella sp. cx-51]MBC9956436.1 alpha/beta hydrolase [Yimella sp. cx-51]QTH38448.1 alpha/beta hydrolase [Yimella sp. cx-51]
MDQPFDQHVRPSDRSSHYGPHDDHVVEHYERASAPRVIFVHGGFWKPKYDRAHLRPTASALWEAGFEVALIEYRRPVEAPRWPEIAADVRAAIESVRDGRRTVIAGHSAGGQLAVWALHQPEGSDLLGAVSLAGCVDLEQAHQDGLGGGAVQALFAGPPLPEADPAALAPPPAPVVLVHGTDDPDVPLSISQRYRDRVAATDAADVPELLVVDGGDHWAPVLPGTETFDAVVAILRRLAGG